LRREGREGKDRRRAKDKKKKWEKLEGKGRGRTKEGEVGGIRHKEMSSSRRDVETAEKKLTSK
jgi:hypothetical protein